MAEHGRQGGVSTGRPFKHVQLTPNTIIIDDVNGNESLMYFGEAKPGTATDAAAWRIKKMTVSAGITAFTWADGNDSFDNVWDDRASLNYS